MLPNVNMTARRDSLGNGNMMMNSTQLTNFYNEKKLNIDSIIKFKRWTKKIIDFIF
jgi:hypothetical protein